VFLFLFAASTFVFAVPPYLSYSGRVFQNGKLFTGAQPMTFKIYDSATAGILLWSTNNANVQVNAGIYDIDLGPLNADVFSNGNSVYLETTVGSETLLPRNKVNSEIFAQQAGGLSSNGVTINAGSGMVVVNGNMKVNAGVNIGFITTTDAQAMGPGALRWNAGVTPNQIEVWDGGGWQ
jgi:hypothetical protein